MSKKQYKKLVRRGRLMPTKETFISTSRQYSSKYRGVLVEFRMKEGWIDDLLKIGVRDSSNTIKGSFPNLPKLRDKFAKGQTWTKTSAYFKGEGGIVNIGLGSGKALESFSKNISSFKIVSKIL